jgi:hypothetical protein
LETEAEEILKRMQRMSAVGLNNVRKRNLEETQRQKQYVHLRCNVAWFIHDKEKERKKKWKPFYVPDETSIEAQLRKTGTENRAGDVRAQKAVEELAVATRQNYERETPRFARARALHTHQEVQTPQTGEKTRRQSLWQSTLTLLQNP